MTGVGKSAPPKEKERNRKGKIEKKGEEKGGGSISSDNSPVSQNALPRAVALASYTDDKITKNTVGFTRKDI